MSNRKLLHNLSYHKTLETYIIYFGGFECHVPIQTSKMYKEIDFKYKHLF
jgi:hypothetical protein